MKVVVDIPEWVIEQYMEILNEQRERNAQNVQLPPITDADVLNVFVQQIYAPAYNRLWQTTSESLRRNHNDEVQRKIDMITQNKNVNIVKAADTQEMPK